jgi:hypothetical protein
VAGDHRTVGCADRADQPEGLQQPDDHPDDDDHANNLLDGAVHGDEVDEVEQQANDDQRNDDSDDSRREHAKLLLRWMRERVAACDDCRKELLAR